jgi:1-acyl-sn-glycerol-3-phosphate acyltransferase
MAKDVPTLRYVGAVRFPIRVAWRFIKGYPESARVTKILVRCFLLTRRVWSKKISPRLGSDPDRNGRIIWDTARTEWVPGLEKLGQLKFVVSGAENIEPGHRYVVAANHTSTLDILALVMAVPDGMFVAKSNVVKSHYPVIGTAVRKGGQIIIERTDTARAVQAINQGLRARPHASPVFFVEGTRSHDGRIAQFKKGAFHVAIDQGLPILPVVVSGSHHALPKGTLLGLKPGSVIDVHCLEPIETAGLTLEQLPALMERTRKLMTDVYYSHPLNPRPPAEPGRPARERADAMMAPPLHHPGSGARPLRAGRGESAWAAGDSNSQPAD